MIRAASFMRFVGSFLWACILGALCSGAVVSGLAFIELIRSMLEEVSK